MGIKVEEINGEKYHFIVGILIEKNNKYLLIERKNPPYGFAAPCGHLTDGETVERALSRKLKTETGFDLVDSAKIYEDVIALSPCSFDGTLNHKTTVFEVSIDGNLKIDEESAKSHGWYNENEISKLKLEPMWKYVFQKLGLV